MNKLLKVYLMNIFKQKGFYICLAIELFFSVFVSILVEKFGVSSSLPVADRILEILEVGIVPIIFVSLFVCSDFTDGATKNFISRGYTRRQLLYAKFIAALIAVFSFYLINAFFIFVFFSKYGMGFDKAHILCILGHIIASIAAISFYVVVANTLEKVSTAITTNVLVYIFVPTIGLLASSVLKYDTNVSTYWVTFLTGLLPGKMTTIKDLLLVSGISIGYLVLLFELSNMIIKRKEVK